MFKSWVLLVFVVCAGAQTLLAVAEHERQAVRDFLIARGEFPDDLTVSTGIEVTFRKYEEERQVGRPFALAAQINDHAGQSLAGQGVELLVIAGGQRVVQALDRYNANTDDGIGGDWRDEKVYFARIFLTRMLPQNSRLAVVERDVFGGNKFRMQTFPLASRAAKYQLAKPIVSEVLESEPPRQRWTLSLTTDIPADRFVEHYIKDEDGVLASRGEWFITDSATSSVTIVGEPYRLYDESKFCFRMVVGIGKPGFDRWSVLPAFSKLDAVITAPFGNCQ